MAGCGLPPKADVNVPFTSQAPTGDWSQPWQDACEETSIYMVSSFYQNDPITRDKAVKQIQEIFKTKNSEIKVSKDESIETIAKLIGLLNLPWSATPVYDPTAEALKAELAAGRPVIVPVYGPLLHNPYYTADYHVLVLTGYDDTKGVFIVNDPGTSHGDGLTFPYATFMNAIHDLDPADQKAGKKAVLFTTANSWTTWFQKLTAPTQP